MPSQWVSGGLEGTGGVSWGPPAHVGEPWGKGTPRVALTLPVPPRHGCDQRGTGGGAGPRLRGAPYTHPRGGQCGPCHPHHCSPPGGCPGTPCLGPPCPGTPTLTITHHQVHPHLGPPPWPRGTVVNPILTGDPFLFWGLSDPVMCQRGCRDTSLYQRATLAPSIVSPSHHIPWGPGGSPPTLGGCAEPSQPQGMSDPPPFLVGVLVTPHVLCCPCPHSGGAPRPITWVPW